MEAADCGLRCIGEGLRNAAVAVGWLRCIMGEGGLTWWFVTTGVLRGKLTDAGA